MSRVLGVDVGGTTIKYGLVSIDGRLSHRGTWPTPQGDPEAQQLIGAINAIVASFGDSGVSAVGVAVPGLVTVDGIAQFSGTLGFREVHLEYELARVLAVPVRVVHDVTAAGVAESRVGQARGVECAVVIQIGTGIAASLVLNGEVHHPHPSVGEIGHTPCAYLRPCPCGLVGCLEMTASGGALSRNYEAATGGRVAAEEVFARVEVGDPDAITVHAEFVDALTTAMVWLAAVLGPARIVIAGGVAGAGDQLLDDLRAALDGKLSFHRKPEIVASEDFAVMGCIGAGLAAWETT